MAPLYVVEQGAVLQRDGERVAVRKEGQLLLSVPVFKLDCVVVFGGVQITTQVMALLLANGVEVTFLSADGRLKGRLLPAESRNVVLRLNQYERYRDDAFRLRVSKNIVRGKLANARALVTRYLRNHPDAELTERVHALEDTIVQVGEAKDLDSLRGLEGRGSAVYFSAFGEMIRGELAFSGRTRRPPRDPVNAMLSLGYSLLTQELFGATAARGFDPYLGFYHDVRYGRPALALDMVEEFRPVVVDRLVLSLVNRRVFGPEDVEQTEDGGFMLTRDALKRFVMAYEDRVNSGPTEAEGGWRAVFREQVGRLVRAVRFGEPYEPVRVEV
jgi:CRISPR-associated protein Cas1